MSNPVQKAAELLGSQVKLARAIGCTPQHVSLMALGRRKVSAEYALRIQTATRGQVALKDLRPDLDDSAGAAGRGEAAA